MIRRGSCLCGGVTYSVTGEMRPIVACHCVQCRKTTGNYVAATSAPRDAIAITGDVRWFRSSDIAHRGFCPTCGSQMFWDGPGQNLSIMAGTLDGETGLALWGHIFCADKGDWYEITDDTLHAQHAHETITTQVPE